VERTVIAARCDVRFGLFGFSKRLLGANRDVRAKLRVVTGDTTKARADEIDGRELAILNEPRLARRR
jgi:hypothetical protein